MAGIILPDDVPRSAFAGSGGRRREKVMQIKVRAAGEQDYEEVFSLLQELWQDRVLDKVVMHSVFSHSLANSNEFMFVASDDGRIVGFTAGDISNNFYHAGLLCYISTLVVHADVRGRGIGTMLLRQVESLACSRNCASIELDANFHRVASHAFYEHFGFTKRAFTFTLSMETIKEHLGGKE